MDGNLIEQKRDPVFSPAFSVTVPNIPMAHYIATKYVLENGLVKRTQYDRKDESTGQYIDPPGREASVLIQIANPFTQPRFPIISFVGIGTYIAEVAFGIKDHLVLTKDEIEKGVSSGTLDTRWPYTYHQRLFNYPSENGPINQVDLALERLKKNLLSRRAVAMTGVPHIDRFLEEDIPCLREIQLRVTESRNELFLDMDAKWRSRDLFQAWPDNTLGITFLQARLADELGDKLGRKVHVGTYTDYSSSLHIYGQAISEKGVANYVAQGFEKAQKRAMTSEFAAENLVIPDLEKTLSESTWNFPDKAKEDIHLMIENLRSVKWIA